MADQTVTIKVPESTPQMSVPTTALKSTELWAVVATAAGLALGAVPPQYATLVASLVGVYVACRTLLKAAHVMGYAQQIPDLPALPDGVVRQTTTTTELKQ